MLRVSKIHPQRFYQIVSVPDRGYVVLTFLLTVKGELPSCESQERELHFRIEGGQKIVKKTMGDCPVEDLIEILTLVADFNPG